MMRTHRVKRTLLHCRIEREINLTNVYTLINFSLLYKNDVLNSSHLTVTCKTMFLGYFKCRSIHCYVIVVIYSILYVNLKYTMLMC